MTDEALMKDPLISRLLQVWGELEVSRAPWAASQASVYQAWALAAVQLAEGAPPSEVCEEYERAARLADVAAAHPDLPATMKERAEVLPAILRRMADSQAPRRVRVTPDVMHASQPGLSRRVVVERDTEGRVLSMAAVDW